MVYHCACYYIILPISNSSMYVCIRAHLHRFSILITLTEKIISMQMGFPKNMSEKLHLGDGKDFKWNGKRGGGSIGAWLPRLYLHTYIFYTKKVVGVLKWCPFLSSSSPTTLTASLVHISPSSSSKYQILILTQRFVCLVCLWAWKWVIPRKK